MQALDVHAHRIESALSQIRQEFDHRFVYFEVRADLEKDAVIARGLVHYPQMAEATLKALARAFPNQAIHSQIKVLTTDWPVRFAEILPPAVMGMNRPDGAPAEAATELLAGQIVRCFMRQEDWVLCQGPDGYLGWLPKDALQSTSRERYLQWILGKRWRLLAPWLDEKRNEYRVGSEFRVTRRNSVHVPAQGATPVPHPGEIIDPSANPFRERVVEVAKSFLGVPYLWGGRTDRGLDCSGYIQVVYARVGVALPRDANQQANMGLLVGHLADYEDLCPGDLLFFMSPVNAKIYHVGISLGGDRFIHSESKRGVTESCLLSRKSNREHPYASNFCFARRVLV